MISSLDLAQLLLAKVFVFIGAGALAARVGFYTPAVSQFVLRNIVMRALLPLLIFEKVLSQLRPDDGGPVAWCFFGALVMVGVSTVTGRLLWPWVAPAPETPERRADAAPEGGTADSGDGARRLYRSFLLVNAFHNYGFLVYPLVLALYGPKGLSLSFVFALTCDGLFWSLGISLIRGRAAARWQEILNPPFLTLLAATALAFLGTAEHLPPGLLGAIGSVTVVTIPLALTTVGAAFMHALRGMKSRPPALRALTSSILMRAVAFPALFAGAALLLLPPSLVRSVLIVQAIMPASMGVVILSALYDGDHSFIVSASGISNLLSILTIPLYLSLLGG